MNFYIFISILCFQFLQVFILLFRRNEIYPMERNLFFSQYMVNARFFLLIVNVQFIIG